MLLSPECSIVPQRCCGELQENTRISIIYNVHSGLNQRNWASLCLYYELPCNILFEEKKERNVKPEKQSFSVILIRQPRPREWELSFGESNVQTVLGKSCWLKCSCKSHTLIPYEVMLYNYERFITNFNIYVCIYCVQVNGFENV